MKTLAEHPAESTSINSNSGALRRIGDEDHQNFVSREVKQSAASKVRSDQSTGQIFGLAVSAVFLVILILNAISC